MVNSFSSIGKVTNKILTDDFEFDKKLKVKAAPIAGVGTTTKAKYKNGGVTGSVEGKGKVYNGLVNYTLTAESNGKVGVEFVVPKAKDNICITLKTDTNGSSKAKAVYEAGDIRSKLSLRSKNGKAPSLLFSNTMFMNATTFGASAAYNVESGQLDKYGCGAHYKCKDMEVSAGLYKKCTLAKINYTHIWSPAATLGAQLSVSSKATVGTVGGKYQIDKSTAGKLKVNSDGVISASLARPLLLNEAGKPWASIAMGSSLRTNCPKYSATNFGFQVALNL